MEKYIILPSLYYFLSFSWFFNNLRHKSSKIFDDGLGEIFISLCEFVLWITGIAYCAYYAYITEWYIFPSLIVIAALFDILINSIFTAFIIFEFKMNMHFFAKFNEICKNRAVCIIVSLFFAFEMFASVVGHEI